MERASLPSGETNSTLMVRWTKRRASVALLSVSSVVGGKTGPTYSVSTSSPFSFRMCSCTISGGVRGGQP